MVIFNSYVSLPEGNNRNVSHYSAMTLLPLTPVAVLQQLPAMWAEAPASISRPQTHATV